MNRIALGILALTFCTGLWAGQLGSAFTYQGELLESGSPADGLYDFELQLYDTDSGGNPVGITVNVDDVMVSQGIFTLELDFGTLPFSGDQLWLLARVRAGNSNGGFTDLLPRQKLTAAPYAIHAEFVAPGSIGNLEIDPAQVQQRVSGACNSGQYIAGINENGSVNCLTDVGITSVSSADIVNGSILSQDLAANAVGNTALDNSQAYTMNGLTLSGQGLNIQSDSDIIINDDFSGLRWRSDDNQREFGSIVVRQQEISFFDETRSIALIHSDDNGIGIGTFSTTNTHTVTMPSLNITGQLSIGLERVSALYALDNEIQNCHSHGNLTCYIGSTTVQCPVGKRVLGGGTSGFSSQYGNVGFSYPVTDTAFACSNSYDIPNATETCYAICARLE